MKRAVVVGLALATIGLGGPALGQPGAPSEVDRQAAGRELAIPKDGVGGCVFRAVKLDVQRRIIEGFMARRGIPPEMREAVAEVAPRCTGRAYSSTDSGLVAASIGAFQRTGVAVYFASALAIGQHRLDEVWRSAPAEEKAPFLRAAASFLDPKAPGTSPTPAETLPLARRLGIEDPNQLSPVNAYYLATTYGEAGEAKLAAEGVKPPPRP